LKIYLVHPGESEFGKLTNEGIWQLKGVARRFLSEKIEADRIYVNGNSVSRQSGDVLSRSLSVPVVSDERFTEISERVVLGEFFEEDIENLDYVNLFVDEIVNKGKDVIIIVGGGVHRAVMSRLTGMSLAETRHFSLLSAGVSVLEYSRDDLRWKIKIVNDRAHLMVP